MLLPSPLSLSSPTPTKFHIYYSLPSNSESQRKKINNYQFRLLKRQVAKQLKAWVPLFWVLFLNLFFGAKWIKKEGGGELSFNIL